MTELNVNNRQLRAEVDGDTPLLWVLREELQLTGTKYGCGGAQCGYCQPGMSMAAAALIAQTPDPSDDDIRSGITNICRCGTYPRVLAATKLAAQRLRGAGAQR